MTDAIPSLRATPKLGVGTKLSYGVGSIAVGVSVLGLSATLLQPYLNRVIGLPALWVGTAIMLTLMLDAVIDPAIGQWSDKLRTRWGRRHPLMYASAPLIAVACIAFWNSPSTWPVTTTGIFVISMLVLLRLCVSLYEIPSSALAPELTSDYHQRTSLFSYRFFFGVVGGLGMNVVLYQVFLSPAAGGILNKAGYANFGILAAGVMAVSILVSAMGTHRHIKDLYQPPVRKVPLSQVAKEIIGTIGNKSLIVVMISGLCSGVSSGLSGALSQYFYIELWGVSAASISYISMSGVLASVSGVVVAGPASRSWGKKRAMLVLFTCSVFTSAIPLSLKLLDLAPTDSGMVLTLLLVDYFIATTLAIAGFIIISSMIADVVEDAAVKTGVRSEGLLLAANGLLPKFTGGIGVFLSGVLLTLVAFPTHAAAGSVDPEIMRRLALIFLPINTGMSLLSILVLLPYKIDEDLHASNVATLEEAAAMAERARIEAARPVVGGAGGA
ncbi:MAG: MFS transporter [Phenylobacterium sp.]|uniref:MFS transporter n=1 Tax=Phenylobacterium sp. TaxID=1871053 RepID=UPI001B4BE489|nr:MFS transporter [Phenylobacterium sp.]MBP7816259.1 MFS transporter [Phenylobacterium sp.]MBP9230800.1 MFS transporter [Phenylobacterium sp.]MBP9753753.1 MFS transporter [Phenylobacterium sp.]